MRTEQIKQILYKGDYQRQDIEVYARAGLNTIGQQLILSLQERA